MQTSPEAASGVAQSVAVGVQRVRAPNAGLMTGSGTNTYLIGTGELVVLDPGPDDARHLRAILHAGAGRVRWILVTHTHRDHSPLAYSLAQETGAGVIGMAPPRDGRQDDTFRPDRVPRDGERLHLGEVTLIAIHTPGHASNCVCYLLESAALLFTGDHVLEGVSPVILPPDGDMAAYLRSLEKLTNYEFERIAPGHGAILERGKAAVEALRAHRAAREAKVLRSMRLLGPATLAGLTPCVYADVPSDRHVWARLTLEAHLIKLAREGRVTEQSGLWRVAAS